MRKTLCITCVWAATVISSLIAQEGDAEKPAQSDAREGPQLQKLTFLISPQDLYFDQEEILVSVEGRAYTISSLKKSGNRWVAQASPR